MRNWLTLLALGLFGCAGAPRSTPLDPVAHARLTVDGFAEANGVVAARLKAATAWAVFPDVEDSAETCAHEGILFQRGEAPSRATLSCTARPVAPAGVSHHLLVVLEDHATLSLLTQRGLDLSDDWHRASDDDLAARIGTKTAWVVTSARDSLLFESWTPRQRLVLAQPE